MQTGVEVAFHGMQPSQHVKERVDQRVARLEQFFGRIDSCRVVVDAPHRHHRKGNHYAVRIEVRVPGGEISVDNKPGDVNAHEDLLVAVRDAFDAAERQLRRWKETHSGRQEIHLAPLQGRIAEISTEKGFGQIDVTDGRLVYFHRNAVVDGSFDALSVGSAVELVVDQGVGEGGPHASTVRPISAQAFMNKA